MAQMVKCLPEMWETWVQSLGWEDPLEKKMTTDSSTLACKIPWTEDPSRLQAMGSAKSQTRLSDFTWFHHRRLEHKSRKSTDTWVNTQVWPWSTKWSMTKANRVSSRECTGHSKHPLSTTQETTLHMNISRLSILKSDWLCSLQLKVEKIYKVSKNKTRSWLWLRSWAPYWQNQI